MQLPGREARIREAPYRRMDTLADALAASIGELCGGPQATTYALFGHSMGALIAHELAHRLLERGAPAPAHLFVSGARAPQLPRDDDRMLHTLPDAEFQAALRDLNGTPELVLADRELMELMLPTLRADFELCETYRPPARGPLPCPITAFGGDQDREVSAAAVQAWQQCTRGAFEVVSLEGDHFFLIARGAQLLEHIELRLARQQRSGKP